MREIKHKYVFILDSDNVLLENSIHGLKETLIRVGADSASFKEARFFSGKKNETTHIWVLKQGWLTLADFFSGTYNPGPLGNYLFTKDIWQKAGEFSELEKGLHDTWTFTFKQLVAGAKIYVDDKGFYYHRYSHQSLTLREYAKQDMEKRILTAVLKDHMNLFDNSEKKYIMDNTPLWMSQLNKRPLKIKSSELGKNGKLHRTPYGIYRSLLKKILKKS